MSRFTHFALTGAFALLATSLVLAQQTQPQVQAQKGTGQTNAGPQLATGYQGITQNPWFSNPTIRQQLKLNDMQFNRLNNAYGQAYQDFQKGLNGLSKNLTAQQRAQQMNQLTQNFNQNFSTATNKALTDPQLRNRYNQMHLQYQGYGAFNDPAVQSKLNLTDSQRQKLNQYGQEWNTQMSKLGQAYRTDPTAASKQFNALRTQSNDRINSVLNQQQQQTWQQMIGTPYNFQPNIYFQGTTSRQ